MTDLLSQVDLSTRKIAELQQGARQGILDQKKLKQVSTCWQLLTDQQATNVASLAGRNWDHYKQEFREDWSKFVETMAGEYLYSRYFFQAVTESTGYLPPRSWHKFNLQTVDGNQLVILTVNSSIIFLGRGSVYSDIGASLSYGPIPLRHTDQANGMQFDSGVKVATVPHIGKLWNIQLPTREPFTPTPDLIYIRGNLEPGKNGASDATVFKALTERI